MKLDDNNEVIVGNQPSSDDILDLKEQKHEVGIELMLKMTKSIFFYQPLTGTNCSRCTNRAELVERMHTDSDYHAPVCKACRDKHVKKRFERYMFKRQPDTRRYLVTADQARHNELARKHV